MDMNLAGAGTRPAEQCTLCEGRRLVYTHETVPTTCPACATARMAPLAPTESQPSDLMLKRRWRYQRTRDNVRNQVEGGQPAREDPREHLRHCPGCPVCNGLLEHYMSCDFCGAWGLKDSDGWGTALPSGAVPCSGCAQAIGGDGRTSEAEPNDRHALAEMHRRKDAALYERNQLVAALAKLFPSGVTRTRIDGWNTEWDSCVRIDLPTGQVSWHFTDSHAHLFAGLPPYPGEWDGHSTEEKYARLAALPRMVIRQEQGDHQSSAEVDAGRVPTT